MSVDRESVDLFVWLGFKSVPAFPDSSSRLVLPGRHGGGFRVQPFAVWASS